MRAMVLAAGYGTRLGSLTSDTPKAMLDVAGRPLIEWILRHLASQGIDRVAVNVHHRGDLIRGHVGDGRGFGLREVAWFEEPELLGTAGGVRNAIDYLEADGPFLVQYGDVVTDQDLRAPAAFHAAHAGLATMLVHRRARSNSVVVLDEEGRVEQFLERPTAAERATAESDWVNSGIAVLDPAVIRQVRDGEHTDFARDVLVPMAGGGALYALPLSGFRVAVDSPARLAELRAAGESGALRLAAEAS